MFNSRSLSSGKAVAVAALAGVFLVAAPAFADTFSVQYFQVAPGSGTTSAGLNPDFYCTSCSSEGTSLNYVTSTLGANGLPVFNPSYTGSGVNPVSPVNLGAGDQILWWTPNANNGVSVDTAKDISSGGTLTVGSSAVNMYPSGQNNSDNPDLETAILNGTFHLATSSDVTFQVGADDDGFVYVDGQLVESLGGIHGDSLAPANTVLLAAGDHTIEIFFADQEMTGASLSFDDDAIPVTAPPTSTTPEPSSIALLGTGLLTLGGAIRRRIQS